METLPSVANADELNSWAERLRALGSSATPPPAAAKTPQASSSAATSANALNASGVGVPTGASPAAGAAESGRGLLPDGLHPPTVPHLFVQRLDALPEPTMEQLLLAMDQLSSKPPQRGWLHSLFGGGGSGGGGSGGAADAVDPLSGGSSQQGGAGRSEVRRLLRQWRQQELAADADTADYSSDPYDSIPRQVELQWRTYAKLYPEDAAAHARAAALLQPSGSGAAAAAGPAAAAGRGSAGGWLPSAVELQRTLQAITTAPAAGSAAGGGGGGSTTAAAAGTTTGASPTAPPSPAREWVARHARQQPVVPFGRDLADPTFLRLLTSLEAWYEDHYERLAPLRRGRRARLLALRGVPLPQDWQLESGSGSKIARNVGTTCHAFALASVAGAALSVSRLPQQHL